MTGRYSGSCCEVAIHLSLGSKGATYFGCDPVETLATGEREQVLDLERHALETKTGTLLGFQVLGDGGAVRLQRRTFDTVADFEEAGVVLLIRPKNGDRLHSHGLLLTVVAGNATVAGREVAASRFPEGLCE